MKSARLKPRSRLRVRTKNWKNELDALCRSVVLRRDGRCQRCGAGSNLQWCHITSRRYLSTRWLPENSAMLCAGCHLWWHHRPLEATAWFQQAFPERATHLMLVASSRQKFDRTATKLWLEQELRRYGEAAP